MSAFSSSAFSTSAFSTSAFDFGATPSTDDSTGRPGGYTYAPSHIKYSNEDNQREKIKKAKTDLEKLENVLKETERKRLLAAESQAHAKERKALKRALELEALENEYLNEINRLLMVKAELMQRIRNEEEILIVMMMAKRRLRGVVQLASIKTLH